MVRCKATRDGLVGTTYIHEGEEFEIDKCPRWATVVKKRTPDKQGDAPDKQGDNQGKGDE